MWKMCLIEIVPQLYHAVQFRLKIFKNFFLETIFIFNLSLIGHSCV
jgi:hypothetical protein